MGSAEESNAPDTSVQEAEEQPLQSSCVKGFKLYCIVAGIMVATILISLDVSIIATAVPTITSYFHSTADIGWYSVAYTLPMCSLQPFTGKVYTIFSLRIVYIVLFSVFLLGSLLCGVSQSSTMFIIGRAVAGIGGSGVVSGGLSVISFVSSSERCPLFMGLTIACYSLGTVIAPIIGGALSEQASWRWCFFLNLPPGVIIIVMLTVFFHPPKTTGSQNPTQTVLQTVRQLDFIGFGLFVPAIVMVLLALQWGGGKYGWNSATIIGLFAGFAGAIIAFTVWELRLRDRALLPFALLGRRSVALSILFAFLFMGSFINSVYYLPEWFQVVMNGSPMRSGVMLLPCVCNQIFGAVVAGVTAKYMKYNNPYLFAGSAFLCLATGLYTTFTPFNTPESHWVGFQILQGLGCGFAAQAPLLTVQSVIKEEDQAQVPVLISAVMFAQYFGSSVMQSVALSIFQNKLVKQLTSEAGLGPAQVEVLLNGGTARVRETVAQLFPDRLSSVLSAYNTAITNVFYLAVASSGLAFVLSLGIEWIRIDGAIKTDTNHTLSDQS